MKTFVLHTLALALGFIAATSNAQNRPLVEVSFVLAEPVFGASVATNTSDLEQFQTNVARASETLLASRIGFLRFGPGSNAYRLRITLDRQLVEDPWTQLIPTRFSFDLATPSPPNAQLNWDFRTAEQYRDPVVPETFLREITNRLAARLEADLASAVTSLFSRIPLAKEVYLLVIPPITLCVFPFSYEEIEAGQNTGFDFATSRQQIIEQHCGARSVAVPASILSNLPPLYVRGIPAQEDARLVRVDHNRRPFQHTRMAELSTTNGLVQGNGLYVTDYVHVPPSESGANPPSTFNLQ